MSASLDIAVIDKEIKSPALKQIAAVIIETYNAIDQGTIDSAQATAKLRVCRSLIQIMALERLRPRDRELIPELPN